MKCSFIVSAYERPDHLRVLLASLKVQTEPNFEVIVMDNGGHRDTAEVAWTFSRFDPRFRYDPCCLKNCYESANAGAERADGTYFCFPSDDDYYVPQFLERMLRKAPAQLIYCDMVYDPTTPDEEYTAIDVLPITGKIDKGGFLVRRECFRPFPWERSQHVADGLLIESLIAAGVRPVKSPGVMWFHN